MNYKKVGVFLGIAYVLFFLVSQPTETAGLVRDALTGVADQVRALVQGAPAEARWLQSSTGGR